MLYSTLHHPAALSPRIPAYAPRQSRHHSLELPEGLPLSSGTAVPCQFPPESNVFLTLLHSPHPPPSAPPSPLPAKCHSPPVCGSQPLWFHFHAPLPAFPEIRPHARNLSSIATPLLSVGEIEYSFRWKKVPASQSGGCQLSPILHISSKHSKLEALSHTPVFDNLVSGTGLPVLYCRLWQKSRRKQKKEMTLPPEWNQPQPNHAICFVHPLRAGIVPGGHRSVCTLPGFLLRQVWHADALHRSQDESPDFG